MKETTVLISGAIIGIALEVAEVLKIKVVVEAMAALIDSVTGVMIVEVSVAVEEAVILGAVVEATLADAVVTGADVAVIGADAAVTGGVAVVSINLLVIITGTLLVEEVGLKNLSMVGLIGKTILVIRMQGKIRKSLLMIRT